MRPNLGRIFHTFAFPSMHQYSRYFGYIQVEVSPLSLKRNGGAEMITFNPLWDTMKQKGISQYALIKTYGISTGTLDALRQNRNVTLNTLNDLCNILNCEISDVVKFTPDKND